MDTIKAIEERRAIKHFDPEHRFTEPEFVVIGKGIKAAWPHPGQLAMDEVVIENMFT